MKNIFEDFQDRLYSGGLADAGGPLMGFLDAEIEWSRQGSEVKVLEPVFEMLSINSILYSPFAEPYKSIINFLAENSAGVIYPKDCETRTFLHDLPIAEKFDTESIVSILKQRKCVIIPGFGLVTIGTVSLEQAFVTFSSVCFASYVKFYSDFLNGIRTGNVSTEYKKQFERVSVFSAEENRCDYSLIHGPFENEKIAQAAMEQAGKLVVDFGLVDSSFGNISCCHDNVIYISQTGSFLDNLHGFIDPCPLDGSSCASITASSELPAHLEIVRQTGAKTILHGHPKFSVILSMDCDEKDCAGRETCHKKCSKNREVCGIPIVSGEVGGGKTGLWTTVPGAMKKGKGCIVYGHGLFTAGDTDFNAPFRQLLEIENDCREEYFRRVGY